MKEMVIGLFLAAALAVAVMLPTETPKPVALIHVEQIHVMEPGETVFSVARRYFGEQQEFKTVYRFIFAVRVRNGLDKSFKAGDPIIIPLALPAK